MIRLSCAAGASPEIARKEIIAAVQKYLSPAAAVVLQSSPVSALFGASDLFLVDKAANRIMAARIQADEGLEQFIISAISYFYWLQETWRAHRRSGDAAEPEVYLFARDISAPTGYLVDKCCQALRLSLIQYHILQIEDLPEPAIFFQRRGPREYVGNMNQALAATAPSPARAPALSALLAEVSPQELQEFSRLKKSYLD